jgi:PhnB protein
MMREASIAPWLSVKNVKEALVYYKAAFSAIEVYRLDDENGNLVVVHLSIKEADFWIQEDLDSNFMSIDRGFLRMILTVENPDWVFQQAISAGAAKVSAVREDHGWRIGHLIDPFGYHWEIGKPLS